MDTLRKIRLQTHDYSLNYLEELPDRSNEYKLVSSSPDYIRIGNISDGRNFVDPVGGPMIVEGEKLACYEPIASTVTNISYEKGIGAIITLEQ